ncbi:27071_t:CDS:1, partial [Dentiscutata erythropus]
RIEHNKDNSIRGIKLNLLDDLAGMNLNSTYQNDVPNGII